MPINPINSNKTVIFHKYFLTLIIQNYGAKVKSINIINQPDILAIINVLSLIYLIGTQ